MKKWIRALLWVSVSATLFISTTTFAFATEEATLIPLSVINEYDVYVKIRETSTEELICKGMSRNTIEMIKSASIEDELTMLSELSASELATLGYSLNQISLIQSYSGERIESNPELRGVFADLTSSLVVESASTNSISIKITFTWSNPPLMSGNAVFDIVAATWQGTNMAGEPLNVAGDPDPTKSYVRVKYHSRSNDAYHHYTERSATYDNAYSHCYANIQMGSPQTDENGKTYYAKESILYVKVDKTGTASISEVAFCVKYGHCIIELTPSVSFPITLSIEFSSGMEEMSADVFRVLSNGSYIPYN